MSDFGRRLGIILYMERQIAYAELLRRHRATVWRMCWLKARGDWERCRDLVQEVSVALWMHFEELRPGVTPAEERAWVRWVTRSTLDHQTRKRRVETLPLTPMHEESIAAEDGQAAVDAILQAEPGTYDAVLMDIQMPVMDGYQATRTIRALDDPARAGVPIVAMTADAFQEDQKKAYDAGMQGHIAKPIDMEQMLDTLKSILGR